MAYQDEESLKAELRSLTEKSRKLRQELRAVVSTADDLTRGLARVPSSGKGRAEPPVVTAHEKPRKDPGAKKR